MWQSLLSGRTGEPVTLALGDRPQYIRQAEQLLLSHLPSLVSVGIGKLASVPAGGAVAVSAAPGAAAPAAGSAPAAGKCRSGSTRCTRPGAPGSLACMGPHSPQPLSLQQRRRKTKRRRSRRNRMTTWDLACLIRVLRACKLNPFYVSLEPPMSLLSEPVLRAGQLWGSQGGGAAAWRAEVVVDNTGDTSYGWVLSVARP